MSVSIGRAHALVLCSLALIIIVMAAPAMAGNAAAGKTKAIVCVGCHGADGNGGADPTWPKLAGQHEGYLAAQLQAFKSGARKDPIMAGIVTSLSRTDMENIAAYFSSLPAKVGVAKSKELVDRGERIYRGGNIKTGVSACMSCHGPSGHGIPVRFPKVSGQNAAYTQKQLLAFKSAERNNDGETMTRIALRMSDADIKAVSEYMAGLH